MADDDLLRGDPFFKVVRDGQWNACVGLQGEEESYVDGYIQAAIELIDAIFEKKLLDKRDTLVFPILYNARHAIELALKFAIGRLEEAKAIKGDNRRPHHDIEAYWKRLNDASVGDEKLATLIAQLKPYIDSLTRIDTDGQQLRYPVNINNDPSLSGQSIVNLSHVHKNLKVLQTLLLDFKDRVVDFVEERRVNTYTERCSRRDLLEIARIMPPCSEWSTDKFASQKAIVKKRFCLSNTQVDKALEKVKRVRETRAMLGLESDLMHLKDEDIVWVVEQWRSWHPKRTEPGPAVVNAADLDVEEIFHSAEVQEEMIAAVKGRLSAQTLADLEAIFYLGSTRNFPEYYESVVERTLEQHAVAKDPDEEIRHLLGKTNFLDSIRASLAKLGRIALAKQLDGM